MRRDNTTIPRMIEAPDQTDVRVDADWKLNSNCAIVWPSLVKLRLARTQIPLVRALK